MRIMTGEARSTSNGNLVLALAAVLFAVAVLPFVLEDDGKGDTAAFAGTTGTATPGPDNVATPPRSTTEPSDPYEEDTPVVPSAPVWDPRKQAFENAASVGTCLYAYQVGDGRGGWSWSTDTPKLVPCRSQEAFVRVAGVNGTCPSGDVGITRWTYGDISLCLERQFQPGQCFLVTREGGTDNAPQYYGYLFTWVDCQAERIPADFDSLLAITAVYQAPSSIPRNVCARSANDRTYYSYWLAKNNSTLVCAAYPNR